jgi:hypothetical protein
VGLLALALLWVNRPLVDSAALLPMPPPQRLPDSEVLRGVEDATGRLMNVGVTVLVTTTPKTPDLDPTIDAMLVLRQSILDATPPSARTRTSRARLNITFVALVTEEVDFRVRKLLAWCGYAVQIVRPPLQPADVRNRRIAKEIVTDGAMGIAEMVKIYGFTMFQFDRVVMLDADVYFHQSLTELLDAFDAAPHAALGWTMGGWEQERINGGVLVFNPHSSGQRHFDAVLDIVKEGDFREGSGWRGSGIGWTYGGRTIQGVLPFYFFHHLPQLRASSAAVRGQPQEAADAAAAAAGGVTNGSFTPADVKLDRCRFNNMVQLEPCKVTPLQRVVSNHFTGECFKPWWCQRSKHALCGSFTDRWWTTWEHVRRTLVKRCEGSVAAPAAREKAQAALKDSASKCTGGYRSLAHAVVGVAMEDTYAARQQRQTPQQLGDSN